LLTIPKNFAESTVTIFNRDVRSSNPFKAGATYNVLSGLNIKITPEIKATKDTILLFGSSMDLTRGHREIGQHIKQGLLSAAQHINRTGGIHNKLYKIAVLDDYLINFRVSYADEGAALTTYAANNFLDKNFGFFYQNSDHGLSGLAGAKQALKKLAITKWAEALYEPNTLQVGEAVKKIRKANPHIIGLFSVVPATIEFLKQLGSEFLVDKKLIALSPLGTDDFRQFAKDNGLSVTYAQAVPNPQSSNLPIVQEYRAALKETGSRPNTYSLEGYIYGALGAELIKRINGPVTPAALASVVNNLKPFNFKGLQIQLDPKTRTLGNYLWLETADGLWIEQKITPSIESK
jgi:ABC-type branched-subunit amino acid transport system substrate-binding protein